MPYFDDRVTVSCAADGQVRSGTILQDGTVTLVEISYHIRSIVQICSRFLGIFFGPISLPSYQVLEFSPSSYPSGIQNSIHFPLHVTFRGHNGWWWSLSST